MPARTLDRPRLSVTITKPQQKRLAAEAERLGLTLGELMRRIVDAWFEQRGVG